MYTLSFDPPIEAIAPIGYTWHADQLHPGTSGAIARPDGAQGERLARLRTYLLSLLDVCNTLEVSATNAEEMEAGRMHAPYLRAALTLLDQHTRFDVFAALIDRGIEFGEAQILQLNRSENLTDQDREQYIATSRDLAELLQIRRAILAFAEHDEK